MKFPTSLWKNSKFLPLSSAFTSCNINLTEILIVASGNINYSVTAAVAVFHWGWSCFFLAYLINRNSIYVKPLSGSFPSTSALYSMQDVKYSLNVDTRGLFSTSLHNVALGVDHSLFKRLLYNIQRWKVEGAVNLISEWKLGASVSTTAAAD